MNEATVSKKLREALVSRGAVCWKTSDRFHASRPDLLLFHNKRCIGIETKIYPAMPTALQKFSLVELKDAGIQTFIASFNKVTKIVALIDLETGERREFFTIKEAAAWLLEQNF